MAEEGESMEGLVKRAKDGDTDAFGSLYTHTYSVIFRFVYGRVGNKTTAEDLTAETYVRALGKLDTFEWRGKDFAAWLTTIARNIVADHYKCSRTRLEVAIANMRDVETPSEETTEDEALLTLDSEELHRAITALGSRQKQCITLRFFQGLSVAETAEVLGSREGAIKTLQHRAVRTLARMIPSARTLN